MLKEQREIIDDDGSPRRWFSDEYFDLIIWLDADKNVAGFQLCYDKGGHERALTWRKGGETTHTSIDDGESSPLKNMSPILVPDGAISFQELQRQFTARAGGMDPAMYHLVMVTLFKGMRNEDF